MSIRRFFLTEAVNKNSAEQANIGAGIDLDEWYTTDDQSNDALTEEAFEEGATSGGYAEGGSLDTGARAGGIKKTWKDALEGKKTKTVKAKDIKPGMITSTGEVKKVTNVGWRNGKQEVEISYGGIGAQGSHASDCVPVDFEYKVLDE